MKSNIILIFLYKLIGLCYHSWTIFYNKEFLSSGTYQPNHKKCIECNKIKSFLAYDNNSGYWKHCWQKKIPNYFKEENGINIYPKILTVTEERDIANKLRKEYRKHKPNTELKEQFCISIFISSMGGWQILIHDNKDIVKYNNLKEAKDHLKDYIKKHNSSELDYKIEKIYSIRTKDTRVTENNICQYCNKELDEDNVYGTCTDCYFEQ